MGGLCRPLHIAAARYQCGTAGALEQRAVCGYTLLEG